MRDPYPRLTLDEVDLIGGWCVSIASRTRPTSDEHVSDGVFPRGAPRPWTATTVFFSVLPFSFLTPPFPEDRDLHFRRVARPRLLPVPLGAHFFPPPPFPLPLSSFPVP